MKYRIIKKGYQLEQQTTYQGIPISIENAPGSTRTGIDPNGKKWNTQMQISYGRIPYTGGDDGEALDVFVDQSNPMCEKVFIVSIVHPETKQYDEEKVFLGFENKQDVMDTFKQHYTNWRKFWGGIRQEHINTFKKRCGRIHGRKFVVKPIRKAEIKNKPGLVLQKRYDKRGRMVNKWVRVANSGGHKKNDSLAGKQSENPSGPTLYRAADNDVVKRGACFSLQKDDAKQYQNNPGYGGSNLYSLQIDDDDILYVDDIDDLLDNYDYDEDKLDDYRNYLTPQLDPGQDLTETQEESIEENAKKMYLDEELKNEGHLLFKIMEHDNYKKISENGYKWVVYEDDFPKGSTTYVYTGNKELKAKPVTDLNKALRWVTVTDESSPMHGRAIPIDEKTNKPDFDQAKEEGYNYNRNVVDWAKKINNETPGQTIKRIERKAERREGKYVTEKEYEKLQTARKRKDGGDANRKLRSGKTKITTSREKKSQKAKTDHVSQSNIASIKKILRPHQKEFVNLALEKYKEGEKGFLLSDGTGTGKTLQELSIAKIKADKGESVLIVTENDRIINDAFKKDADLIDTEIQAIKKERDISKPLEGNIHITTYNNLKHLKHLNFDQLILDESHNLKNYTSQKTKNGTTMIKNSKNVLMATATPMDKAKHIGYIAKSLGISHSMLMDDLGYEWGEIARNVFGYKMKYGVTDEEVLHRIGAFYDQITEKGLMLKREVSVDNVDFDIGDISLSDEQMSKYKKEVNEMYHLIDSAPPRERGIAKATGLMNVRRLLEEFKVPYTVDAIKDEIKAGRKVVVFAARVNESETLGGDSTPGTMKLLQEKLDKLGIKHVGVFGKNKNVKSKLKNFNTGKAQVFLTTPQSGGTGINLDDTVGNSPRSAIVMTAPFSANEYCQMIGRINRLNTKSDAKVISLYSNTEVDDWNKNISQVKLKTLGATVKGDYEKMSQAQLSALETMNDATLMDKIKSGKLSKNISVPVSNQHEFRSLAKKYGKKDDSGKIKVLKRIDDLKGVDWKTTDQSFVVNFGKHKGKPFKDLPSGYKQWMMETANIEVPAAMKNMATYKGRKYEVVWSGKTRRGHGTKLKNEYGRQFWVDTSEIKKAIILNRTEPAIRYRIIKKPRRIS